MSALPRMFRVRRRKLELPDTCTLDLEPCEGATPAFQPGQFAMLYRPGVGEIPISISGRPGILVHTIRDVGAVSHALTRVKPGEMVGVRGPFGTAWPLEQPPGTDVVIVAGGIGLAPVRPALYFCLDHRPRFGRVTLIYGARTPHDLLYRRELERWRSRLDLEVMVTVDRAERDWRGHVGVVTTLLGRADFNPASAVAITCGPEIMMRFVAGGLESRGLSPDRIFVSLERNMKCGEGTCGHCQLGPMLVCRDGPVVAYDRVARWLAAREV